MKYAVMTVGEWGEDTEAFGPFKSERAAEEFARRYNEEGVRPAYPVIAVELYPVRIGLEAIRSTAAENERDNF